MKVSVSDKTHASEISQRAEFSSASTVEPFALAAEGFASIGLGVFPVSKDKRPMVKGPQRFGCNAALRVSERFPNANVGLWCGERSGITVVDVDEPGLEALRRAIFRFGHTPLIVRTHSGKHHLYYRWNGERRRTNATPGFMKLDLLGNGFAVVPPSIGEKGPYTLIHDPLGNARDGTFEEYIELLGRRAHLPTIKIGAITEPLLRPRSATLHRLRPKSPPKTPTETPTEEGQRNKELFAECRRAAAVARSLDDVMVAARDWNAQLPRPLFDDEVVRTATSAWEYKRNGRLLNKGCESHAFVTAREVQRLGGVLNGLPLRLLLKLRTSHLPEREFLMAQRALARHFRCRSTAVLESIAILMHHGLIERLPGVRGPRGAPLYRLPLRPPSKFRDNELPFD